MIFNTATDKQPTFFGTIAAAVFAFTDANKPVDASTRVCIRRRVNLDSSTFQGFEWAISDSATNGRAIRIRDLNESAIEGVFKKEWDDNWMESLAYFRELEFFDSPAEAAGDFAERFQAVYGCQDISNMECAVVRHRNCEKYAVILGVGDEEESAYDYEIGCRLRDAKRAHRWFWGALNDAEFFYQPKALTSWNWSGGRGANLSL